MPEKRADRPNPGTAPRREEAEEGDRMEGSFDPGISGPYARQPNGPAARSEPDEGAEEAPEEEGS